MTLPEGLSPDQAQALSCLLAPPQPAAIKLQPATVARWCPLCGTQHAVAKGAPSPWPAITRNQIEALPALLLALQRCQECAVIVQRLADGMRNISAIHGSKFSIEANAIHAVASNAIALATRGDK